MVKWNTRVSALYALGIWTMVSSYAYYRYTGQYDVTMPGEEQSYHMEHTSQWARWMQFGRRLTSGLKLLFFKKKKKKKVQKPKFQCQVKTPRDVFLKVVKPLFLYLLLVHA